MRTTEQTPENQGVLATKSRLWAVVLVVALVGLFGYNVYQGFFLCDDAFISFRYARHFADGDGLVWNVGERVEGYSNFLWVVLLGVFLKMGAQPEISSVVFGIASGLLLLAAVMLLSARVYGRRNLLIYFAPFALAANPAFTAWASGGLETMTYALLIFAGIASLLQVRRTEQETRWLLASSLIFALANLTRPDAPLFAGVTALFVFGEKLVKERRLPLRAALTWALPYAAIVATHLLWRHSYYGYWLPNTYYAKVNKPWWDQGLRYLDLFADGYGIYFLLPLALLALVWRPRFEAWLFATIVAAWSTYVAKIGGDWMQDRMLIVYFAPLYWLVGDGLERIPRLAAAKPRLARGLAALTAGLAVAILSMTFLGNRAEVSMAYIGSGKETSMAEMVERKIASVNALRFYAFTRAQQGMFLRSLIDEGILPDDLVLGVGGAGALPYYVMWPTVDFIGLTDAHVAHQPAEDAKHVLAGHQQWGSLDYLRGRGVVMLDALNQIVFDEPYDPENDPHAVYRIMVIPGVKLRTVKVKGKYLVFASLVPEEEFQRIFGHLEILE